MSTEKWLDEAWNLAIHKVKTASLRIGSQFPHGSHDGQYQLMKPDYWTAGFWPGMLWLAYRDNRDEELRRLAEECELRLDPVLYGFHELSHDTGFMWTLTAVADYTITGSSASRDRALIAASHLAGRFNLQGRFIRAWNNPERTGWAIIDCLMNLPLLYWASAETADPRFAQIAKAHAEMAVKHLIREDGSAYHVVMFDPATGEKEGYLGGQGYAAESAWARGASWGLYGAALSYQHTGDPLFLDAAERAADFFLNHLPEDLVPYWDFRLPATDGAPRDSSASAIAATGLLDLAALTAGGASDRYRNGAMAILQSLSSAAYAGGDGEEALLLHGTGNLPGNQNIDKPLIYGDYYYLEALSKLRGGSSFWAPNAWRQ
ncbi:glycoside hydrolase family 88 protein [Paenibacillus sp. YN15]|uniref:glycoside hydrolase family 88 protein n=1 Tax=Paenibacillus sp. YN15 TaxID=1742774 RepID=UPI000DCDE0F3|nr:glycoside hydrolase family 88 protein [Paenibacillus sp. YN15]RAU93296.1 glycosyl hydrolase [Paenibacillus sp. YN15]